MAKTKCKKHKIQKQILNLQRGRFAHYGGGSFHPSRPEVTLRVSGGGWRVWGVGCRV